MAKKNKIYVTTMYRWGDTEEHSYVVYASFSKHRAIEAGKKEQEYRGNKYMPQVVEFSPGDIESKRVVYPLRKSPCLV